MYERTYNVYALCTLVSTCPRLVSSIFIPNVSRLRRPVSISHQISSFAKASVSLRVSTVLRNSKTQLGAERVNQAARQTNFLKTQKATRSFASQSSRDVYVYTRTYPQSRCKRRARALATCHPTREQRPLDPSHTPAHFQKRRTTPPSSPCYSLRPRQKTTSRPCLKAVELDL